MENGARGDRLRAVRRQVAALERGGRRAGVLPFGVPAIDRALPEGGLALGALHEICGQTADEEDGAVAAGFLAGILARLSALRPVLWCGRVADLYPPGLALLGLVPARLLMAKCRTDQDILWAMEEGLKTPALAAVVGEVSALPGPSSRRLQLAAEAAGVTAFALRRWRDAGAAARERGAPVAAMTRWRVGALPSIPEPGEPGVGRSRWQVELLRCRGGVPASWCVEECDATGHVTLSAELADRAVADGERRIAG